MSLLSNMLSRLVITLFPRSKLLLISWLQSPSAVILEPPKIKLATVSTVSPSICHEVMGPDAMILVFFFKFYFIFKLYIIVLVLPNIKMNPPQVYMCSPPWTLLPPHTIPLGHPSALAPSIQYRASNLDWHFISYMIFTCFNAILPNLPPSPSPIESIRLFSNLSFILSIGSKLRRENLFNGLLKLQRYQPNIRIFLVH